MIKSVKKITSSIALKRLLLVVVGVTGLLISGLTLAAAQADSLWLKSGDPSYSSRSVSVGLDPQENADACLSPQTFIVKVFKPQLPVEQESEASKDCTVQTDYGIVSRDGYMRLDKARLANKLKRPDGSNATPVMLPHSPKLFVVETDGSIGVYDHPKSVQLVSNPDTNQTVWRDSKFYQIPQQPDHYITDKAGNRLRGLVTYNNMAHANNGAYLLFAIKGKTLVKVDTNTLVIQTVGDLRSSGVPPFDQTMAVSNDGRYIALAGTSQRDDGSSGNQYKLRVYDTDTCEPTPDVYDGLPASGCEFKDFYQHIQTNESGLDSAHGARFSSDATQLSFTIVTPSGENKRLLVAAPGYQPSGLEYLALGDSFSSGEGETDEAFYLPGTDGDATLPPEFEGLINVKKEKCHISQRSYPYLIAQQMQLSPSQFKSVACSGAATGDVLGAPNGKIGTNDQSSNVYLGQSQRISGDVTEIELRDIRDHAINNFIPARNSQLAFVERYKPKIITLTIGGNDIGFGNKLKACVMSAINPLPGPAPTCRFAEEDRTLEGDDLQSMYNTLFQTYRKIRQASEASKLYVVGYPNFIDDTGSCGNNVNLDEAERLYVREAVHYMNQVIKHAAIDAGAYYIDAEKSLAGFGLCSSAADKDVAFNGLLKGNDTPYRTFGPFGQESYHPNQLGHVLLKNAILSKATGNLANYNPCNDTFTDDPNDHRCSSGTIARLGVPAKTAYFDAPSTTIGTYARLMQEEVVTKVQQASLHLVTTAVNTAFKLTLFSEPHNIGTFTTDGEGVLQATIALPETIAPGYHTLRAEGQLPSGEPVVYYQVIFVPGQEHDIDDDGLPDDTDACPFVTPANQDNDADTIDDACDGYIGEPQVLAAPTVQLPGFVNANNKHAVTVSGTGEVDAQVSISADDANPATPAITAESNVSTTGYSMPLDLFSLDDGTLSVVVVLKKQNRISPDATATVTKDTKAPVTTATLNPAANPAGWNNGETMAHLQAADTGTGLAKLTYHITGSQPMAETISPDATASVNITAEGETTIHYFATDKAGNTEVTKSQIVRRDSVGPVTSIDKPQRPLLFSFLEDQLTGKANDTLSGISRTEVTFKNLVTGTRTTFPATCTAGCGNQTATWSIAPKLPTGIYSVRAVSADAASNSGPLSYQLNIVVVSFKNVITQGWNMQNFEHSLAQMLQ